jgi:CHAT domain-containing protein
MSLDFELAIRERRQEAVRLAGKGRFPEALDLAYQAHDEVCRRWPRLHFRRAHSLHLLAELYRSVGEYALAERFYCEALQVYQAVSLPPEPDAARRLHDLACFLADEMGRLEADDPVYQNAYQVFLSTEGEDIPCYSASQHGLACVYAATGRVPEALSLMRRAAAGDDVLLGRVFAVASEAQRAAFLRNVRVHFSLFLSLVHAHFRDSAAAARAALELTWRRKALGVEALAVQRDAVLGGRRPSLEPLLGELRVLRGWIARKTLAGPGEEGPAGHLECLQRWHAERNGLERRLARQIPEISLEAQLRGAGLEAVARALPPDAALVEFVRFPLFDFRADPGRVPAAPPTRYLAFVSPGPADGPRLLDLGPAEPIDRMIADWRTRLAGEAEPRDLVKAGPAPDPGPAGDAGASLRAAAFDPLVPALGGRRRLLLAPDGALNRLPFEALPGADGRSLIDAYRLSYLAVGREVLGFGRRAAAAAGPPVVIADPDFDLGASGGPPAAPGGVTAPGRHAPDLPRDTLHFRRLPGTRAEGERVAGLLSVEPWLGEAALEARVKACRSPRILHLATHGFFLPDSRPGPGPARGPGLPAEAEDEAFGPRLSGAAAENPLLRSGLALAGVNAWLRRGAPPPEAEDGLLTAEDVTGLDLLGTELVVLSACQTGLGEVQDGEGVFGLRRAFALAGARTLVLSLWKVPDAATTLLMGRFYENLIRGGKDRDLALHEAQQYTRDLTVRQIREYFLASGGGSGLDPFPPAAGLPDDHRPFAAPYYWGAFICQGDPTPLGEPLSAR